MRALFFDIATRPREPMTSYERERAIFAERDRELGRRRRRPLLRGR